MDEFKEDIKEIKGHVLKLVEQGAVHNTILKEHHRRSTALEEIVIPLKIKVTFAEKVAKGLAYIGSGVLIKLIADYFLKRV